MCMCMFAYPVEEWLQQDASSPSIPATEQYHSKAMYICKYEILEFQVYRNISSCQ
jgi:hypothetical protein